MKLGDPHSAPGMQQAPVCRAQEGGCSQVEESTSMFQCDVGRTAWAKSITWPKGAPPARPHCLPCASWECGEFRVQQGQAHAPCPQISCLGHAWFDPTLEHIVLVLDLTLPLLEQKSAALLWVPIGTSPLQGQKWVESVPPLLALLASYEANTSS